ncbi:MAG: phosphoadenylyl-sulfate reductase [Chitinophagales bacterium]
MKTFEEIRDAVFTYTAKGMTLCTSSSFQTHSTVMLHILSRIDKKIPVYFLHTGFHFPETIAYKEQITRSFGLHTIDLFSTVTKSRQLDAQGRFLFTSDPDLCCYLNKIQPMEPILDTYDVWINGVRADQNANRSTFAMEEKTNRKAVRFHPMLDWTGKMIYDYIRTYDIPHHPLDAKGYMSIGCEPCTRKLTAEMLSDERNARWFGMSKTECGLHTELIKK